MGRRTAVFEMHGFAWTKALPPPSARATIGTTRTVAEDGLELEAGVYRPARAPEKKIFVTSAHGGPTERFDFTSCPEIECVVELGCTVLAPNFRGSTGYGRAFVCADLGERRFDVIDDWLLFIDRGPDLLGKTFDHIVQQGASYGGFLANSGALARPNTTSVVISLFGIAHLSRFLASTADWRRTDREQEYGSNELNAEFLAQISPIASLAGLPVPIMLSHSEADIRVPIAQSRAVQAARARSPYQTILHPVPGECHSYKYPRNRVDFMVRVGAFLEQFLS